MQIRQIGTAFYIAVLVSFFIFKVASASSNGSTLTASVSVICPFNVTLNMLPGYARPGIITFNYTIHTTAQCNATGLSGYYKVTNTTGIVYSNSISLARVNETPVEFQMQLNTTKLKAGSYTANLTFSGFNTKSTSFARFSLLNAVNIIISRFSSQSVVQYAPETFYVQLYNNGSFSSSNITLEIRITGAANYNFNYSEPAMSPMEYYNTSISIPNITSTVGSYTANATAYYVVNNTKKKSNSFLSNYVVSTPPPSAPPPPPKKIVKPVVSMPQLALTYVPLYTEETVGVSSVSQISFKNTGNAAENVRVEIPSAYSGFVSLSANSITLQPGGSASIQLLFMPQPSSNVGSYSIPINVTANIANITTSQTEYISITVNPSVQGKQQINSQVYLTNSTNDASGIVQAANPTNSTLQNVTIETLLPKGIAKSVSQITAYGLPNNITIENGYYRIRWFVGTLPKGQVVYAYYSVANVSEQPMLMEAQTVLRVPTLVPPQNILKVINMAVPQAFTNSTAYIEIDSLYTGTSPQRINYILTGPMGISVSNPSQTVNATPNQFISTTFNIATGGVAGSYLFNLYVSTAGANLTYTIPLIVLQKPVTYTTTVPPTPKPTPIVSGYWLMVSIFSVIGILLIAASVVFAKKGRSKPVYNPERAEHLRMLREQIKRSDSNE
jgi:hypothetical protein